MSFTSTVHRRLAATVNYPFAPIRSKRSGRLSRTTPCLHYVNRPGTRNISTQPRSFPRTGFKQISTDQLIQEETLPGYQAHRYYPVRIGQVLRDRYQVVGKLGFGGGSTVWLCRDLGDESFVSIKICTTGDTGTKDANQEIDISNHIKFIDAPHHPGKGLVRTVTDHFEIASPVGCHQCLVFAPLGRTLTEFRKLFPGNALTADVLRQTLLCVAMALDFLHQVGVVHTDLSPNNILAGLETRDSGVFQRIEDLELTTPSPRKILPDREIYLSYELSITHGPPVITDFGAARLGEPGEKHTGDVMPGVYRAPEIIMEGEWDSKVDMWSLGVMVWDLFEGGRLFRAISANHLDDELHLAEMVSLLGPPPAGFLQRYQHSSKYWDSAGKWIASTPIPDQSLESRETKLHGKEKELLLRFVRKVLTWLPEDRASAEDLYKDEFLNGYTRHEGHLAAERAAEEAKSPSTSNDQ